MVKCANNFKLRQMSGINWENHKKRPVLLKSNQGKQSQKYMKMIQV